MMSSTVLRVESAILIWTISWSICKLQSKWVSEIGSLVIMLIITSLEKSAFYSVSLDRKTGRWSIAEKLLVTLILEKETGEI